jgi:diadenosine tetraphosphatase ApaH/serine/threonine PP2A family protein phosphatase
MISQPPDSMRKSLCGIIERIIKSCNDGSRGCTQFATSTAVLKVVEDCASIFSAEPVVLTLSGEFIIVGDLHGHISSLVSIFDDLGDPGCCHYLFLGDYVDRGPSSSEIIVLLYILKVLFPANIFPLRGNHEFKSMTCSYDFRSECCSRFLPQVHERTVESFDSLPVAAIVNSAIFCVDGGITPSYSSRGFVMGLTKPLGKRTGSSTDLLWSDPRADVEGGRRNGREQGFEFGSDVFCRFLKDCHFELMVRSHELCPNGFDWSLGADCPFLTIFSCFGYCGSDNESCDLMITDANGQELVEARRTSRYLLPGFVLRSVHASLAFPLGFGFVPANRDAILSVRVF